MAAEAHAQGSLDGDTDVPYVITPQAVVDAMLELAAVGSSDQLIDLGSGDGRIVITAAQRWGTRGLGVEIDPSLVRLARNRAQQAGVEDKVRFEAQDLFATDLSPASVITLYLLPAVNLMLRPRLQALRPGTRIVSHDWDMGDWQPQKTIEVPAPGKPVGLRKVSRLMLWTVGQG
ncbi:MAG: SAM-dependent methyltransferase [Burkholderiales bacterium]